MNAVIVQNHILRLADNGEIESADTYAFQMPKFASRTPESMKLTGGDWAVIKDVLARFKAIFPDLPEELPHSERRTSVANAGGVVK